MIPFHSLFPELAQREVRCVHIGPAPNSVPDIGLQADEYIYVEFYCDDLECDCRRVFLQVIAKNQPAGKTKRSTANAWDGTRRTPGASFVANSTRSIRSPNSRRTFWICSSEWCWTSPIACGCGGITGGSKRSLRDVTLKNTDKATAAKQPSI
jgi:hypothetical protein